MRVGNPFPLYSGCLGFIDFTIVSAFTQHFLLLLSVAWIVTLNPQLRLFEADMEDVSRTLISGGRNLFPNKLRQE